MNIITEENLARRRAVSRVTERANFKERSLTSLAQLGIIDRGWEGYFVAPPTRVRDYFVVPDR